MDEAPDAAIRCDVLVIGAGLPGLAVAGDARRAGVREVVVLDLDDIEQVGERPPVEIVAGCGIEAIRPVGDGVRVDTSDGPFEARVVIDSRPLHADASPQDIPVDPSLAAQVHVRPTGFDPEGDDLLVVGSGERAVSDAAQLAAAGGRVVLAMTGRFDDLAPLARSTLVRLEHDGDLTILWRSRRTG